MQQRSHYSPRTQLSFQRRLRRPTAAKLLSEACGSRRWKSGTIDGRLHGKMHATLTYMRMQSKCRQPSQRLRSLAEGLHGNATLLYCTWGLSWDGTEPGVPVLGAKGGSLT